jgi:hypothetical protein
MMLNFSILFISLILFNILVENRMAGWSLHIGIRTE